MFDSNPSVSLEDSARVHLMHSAWDAYFGRYPVALHNRPRKTSDAVIVNRCRPIVDKGVSFLFGKEIAFQTAAGTDPIAQDYLDALWKANRKMTLLQKLGINGAVTGHAFIKVVPGIPFPRLIVLDPASVHVQFAPDDVDNVTSYTIQYEATDGTGATVSIRQLVTRDTPASWLILDQRRVNDKAQWETTDTTLWNYPFAPIVECQNLPAPNEFWGLPDLSPDLIQLNKDLNFVYSNIQRIIRFHAHPKTYVSGLNGNKLSTAPDETIVLPQGATMASLEMHGDLASSVTHAHSLETAMDVLSRVPSVSLGDLQDVPRGTISGVALELLFMALTEKTESKRRLYGDLLEELNRRLLAMAGYGDAVEVIIHWPEMIPVDGLQAVQQAQLYLAIGVSKDTVFSKLGFNYAEEAAKLALQNTPPSPGLGDNTDQQITPTTQESPTSSDEENETRDEDTSNVALANLVN